MKLPTLRSRKRATPPAEARLAAFEEVEPGEGGAPEMPSAPISDVGVDYGVEPDTGDRGTTTGTETLNLEVALLSIAAVDEIGAEIARKAAGALTKADLKGVVLATPDLLAVLRLRASLVDQLTALEGIVVSALDAPDVEHVDAAAFGLPAATLAVQGVRKAAQSASNALSVFAVSTRYSGRKDTVRQVTLDAALAKHLSQGGVTVQTPLYALPEPQADGFVARALDLQRKCRVAIAAGTAPPEVMAAGQSVDAIVAAVFGTNADQASDPAARLAQQMMMADSIAASVEEGFGILFADLTVTGGSYRTRRWIFNFLTGSDGLSYSGGAAATFFLFGRDQKSALASDTIFFATPHDRFARTPGRHRATNIEPRS